MRWRDGDSNVRSVWLCSRNDAVGNVGVIIAGIVVAITGAAWPDLLVAVLLATLFSALVPSQSFLRREPNLNPVRLSNMIHAEPGTHRSLCSSMAVSRFPLGFSQNALLRSTVISRHFSRLWSGVAMHGHASNDLCDGVDK